MNERYRFAINWDSKPIRSYIMSTKLMTVQGEALAGKPWNIYPRPQLKRDNYVNLNGNWDFTVSMESALPADFDRTIRVPFCPESTLSGIEEHFPEGSYLFYRCGFSRPEGQRVLLHIGAADQELTCYVNNIEIGSHEGGYEAITFDITHALQEENTVVLRCKDDLRDQSYPYGKQVMQRGGMWYTPVSGIWQSVWLEGVCENYVNSLDIQATLTQATVTITPTLSGKIICEGVSYPLVDGKAIIMPNAPRLWTPEEPNLYPFTVEAGEDRFESYFALRTLETKTVGGYPRLCLNGKSYFFHGLLDQGYWPDGLFTPAAPQCYAEDILRAKELGFNMLRKHIKVEAEEFYYQCDRLGMVVFQDMVNNGDYNFLRDTVAPTFLSQHKNDKNMHPDAKTRQRFMNGMEATVRQLKNHPCICYWTIFNEAWGQFDSTPVYLHLKALDNSRFIDTTSGWYRGSKSDVESLHIYFDMWHRLKKSAKPIVLSEFGGFTYAACDHIFNTENTYGYGTCKTPEALTEKLRKIYEQRVIPAAKKGLCASVYTQISDVEDEINGLLTYDRKVVKPDLETMLSIAHQLQTAVR